MEWQHLKTAADQVATLS